MTAPHFEAAAPVVIDSHVHFVAPGYAGSDDSDRFRPRILLEQGRQSEVRLGGRAVDSVLGEMSRAEVLLAELSDAGADGAVLSPWVSTFPSGVDDGAATELCRRQNDAMAAVVLANGGRFAGLGAVPLQAPELAARVLGEAMGMGLVGVEVAAISQGRGLGDKSLEPLWDAAEALGAVIFVHPGSHGLAIDLLGEHYLWNAVGNPVETAFSAAQLVMAGVFDRHPDLVILLAHGGGVLPSVASRITRAWHQRPEARSDTSMAPEESIRRFYFDTVLHDQELLGALVSFAGADHVLMGSDHPFDMGVDDPVGAVRALGLSEGDELAILGGNARRLAFPSPRSNQGAERASPIS
ncbi:MAG: amidohydrolase family protein [Acidimicrobiales bacterium]